MKKPKGRLYQICDEFGLKVWPYTRRPYKPRGRVTRAKRSLNDLLAKHGEGHLRLTLSLIFSPVRGESIRELHSSTLRAVSDVILEHPEWENHLVSAMDQIKLGELEETASKIKMGSYRNTMGVLLAAEIKKAMEGE